MAIPCACYWTRNWTGSAPCCLPFPRRAAARSLEVCANGWAVEMVVTPCVTRTALNRCDRDVLTALPDSPGRMTEPQLLTALAEAGAEWSARTVQRALARLLRRDLISSRRKSPRGYSRTSLPA